MKINLSSICAEDSHWSKRVQSASRLL